MAPKSAEPLDTELAELPQVLRWREWMARVEAVRFASPVPVDRDLLARVDGGDARPPRHRAQHNSGEGLA